MKRTHLVIIDNGEVYSSHRHWVVCSCATREAADKLVKLFDLWFKHATVAYDNDELHKFMVNNKPPIWNSTSEDWDADYWRPTNYSATVIEVPEWAENLP